MIARLMKRRSFLALGAAAAVAPVLPIEAGPALLPCPPPSAGLVSLLEWLEARDLIWRNLHNAVGMELGLYRSISHAIGTTA